MMMAQIITEEILQERVRDALKEVKDPEIPTLSLEELGMVFSISVTGQHAHVQLIPTFVGCPAVELIRRLVAGKVKEVDGIDSTEVTFVMDVPWTSDRITEEGRAKLQEFGIAPPPREFTPRSAPSCPYCGASETDVVSLFGPTACRSIFYCKSCQQPFEGLKYV